ncbi:F-box protein At5g49610-like [Mangifera indica]|uniref:F-box protein At5g49610-like n=1 Tax=Mangifera indica TaxID=29780 RepID=UPI001CFC0D33|nr:F-box protein At5g49610-like [Mangifera indica]
MADTCFMNKLPDDLLLKVFLGLSAKSVLRCMQVCKQWRHLISSPFFFRSLLHSHHQDNIPGIIVQYRTFKYNSIRRPIDLEAPDDLKLKFVQPPNPWGLSVIASFKDLLLCVDNSRSFCICNPTTKQSLKLPPLSRPHDLYHVGFICYPLSNTDIRYKYKVVLIESIHQYSDKLKMSIFCSERGKWSSFQASCPRRMRTKNLKSVGFAFNGILHWLNPLGFVVAYDALKNKVGLINLPNQAIRTNCSYLGVCEGSLRLVQVNNFDVVNKIVGVWRLEDCNAGKWRREHSVVWLGERNLDFVAFHPDIADLLYLKRDAKILCCNLETGSLEEMDPQMDEFCCYPFVQPWWPTPVPRNVAASQWPNPIPDLVDDRESETIFNVFEKIK